MIGSTLLLIRSLIQNGANPKPATQAMRQITLLFHQVASVSFRLFGIQNFAVKDFTLLHAGYNMR